MIQRKSLNITKQLGLWLIFALLFSASSYGASYLMITDLGSSAEMIRRGNIEGFSMGSNAIFENPAALHNINLVSTSVFSTQIIKEVNYRNVSIAYKSKVRYLELGTWMPVSTKFQEHKCQIKMW